LTSRGGPVRLPDHEDVRGAVAPARTSFLLRLSRPSGSSPAAPRARRTSGPRCRR
jgi:hypothetical protein